MQDYTGTGWTRRTDNLTIAIVEDRHAPSMKYTRPLRAKDDTGRHFWVKPADLQRRYTPTTPSTVPHSTTYTTRRLERARGSALPGGCTSGAASSHYSPTPRDTQQKEPTAP